MNTTQQHSYIFFIAKDEIGLNDLKYGATYQDHLIKITIEYSDITNAQNLVFELNDKLSLMIDIYEDEQIELNMLPDALKIAENIYKKETDKEKRASMYKFIKAIKTAILYSSPLLIWW